MITIQQLLHVAPFSEDMRAELLAACDSLSVERKFELENLCWALISQKYNNDLRAKEELAVLEMAKGEKTYTPEDFEKMADEQFSEIVKQFEAEAQEEDINHIRNRLVKIVQESN